MVSCLSALHFALTLLIVSVFLPKQLKLLSSYFQPKWFIIKQKKSFHSLCNIGLSTTSYKNNGLHLYVLNRRQWFLYNYFMFNASELQWNITSFITICIDAICSTIKTFLSLRIIIAIFKTLFLTIMVFFF